MSPELKQRHKRELNWKKAIPFVTALALSLCVGTPVLGWAHLDNTCQPNTSSHFRDTFFNRFTSTYEAGFHCPNGINVDVSYRDKNAYKGPSFSFGIGLANTSNVFTVGPFGFTVYGSQKALFGFGLNIDY